MILISQPLTRPHPPHSTFLRIITFHYWGKITWLNRTHCHFKHTLTLIHTHTHVWAATLTLAPPSSSLTKPQTTPSPPPPHTRGALRSESTVHDHRHTSSANLRVSDCSPQGGNRHWHFLSDACLPLSPHSWKTAARWRDGAALPSLGGSLRDAPPPCLDSRVPLDSSGLAGEQRSTICRGRGLRLSLLFWPLQRPVFPHHGFPKHILPSFNPPPPPPLSPKPFSQSLFIC